MGGKIKDYYHDLGIKYLSHNLSLINGIVATRDGLDTFIITHNKEVVEIELHPRCEVGDLVYIFIEDGKVRMLSEEEYKEALYLFSQFDKYRERKILNLTKDKKKFKKSKKIIDIEW